MSGGIGPDEWLGEKTVEPYERITLSDLGERMGMDALTDVRTHYNPLLDSMAQTFQRCLELAQKKNADYAAGSDPFKNFRASELVGVDPGRAILVRLTDKLSRLGNLLDAEPKVQNESARDTLDDMVNYAAILIALLED